MLSPLGKKRRRYCRWQPVGRRYELYRAAGIFIGKRARPPAREKACLLAGNDVDIAARIHGFRFRRVTTPLFSLSRSLSFSTLHPTLTTRLPSVQSCPVQFFFRRSGRHNRELSETFEFQSPYGFPLVPGFLLSFILAVPSSVRM